jgi:hypothetical protein
MNRNSILQVVLIMLGIGIVVLLRAYGDKRYEVSQTTHRIAELTDTIRLKDMRIDTLGAEASYQRTLAERCQAHEQLRNAERRVRHEPIPLIPFQYDNP